MQFQIGITVQTRFCIINCHTQTHNCQHNVPRPHWGQIMLLVNNKNQNMYLITLAKWTMYILNPLTLFRGKSPSTKFSPLVHCPGDVGTRVFGRRVLVTIFYIFRRRISINRRSRVRMIPVVTSELYDHWQRRTCWGVGWCELARNH